MRTANFRSGAAGLAALFCLALLPLLPASADARMREESLVLETSGGEKSIMIEVATTTEEKALGLMFRTNLADDHGMLFLEEGGSHEAQMWMRNTFIPLDMVFIRADGTVHRIAAMTVPHSEEIVASEGPVAAVLEMAGGAAGRLGLKAGDKVRHKAFDKK